MPLPIANSRLVFGLFEIDVQTGELWRAGFRVKLQNQPTKVLLTLLEHPGQVVTRDELQLKIWGPDMNVDFDHSLGTAINKIREALGDSAENPRFVETLARRGYRFIAPVQPADTTRSASARPGPISPRAPLQRVPVPLSVHEPDSAAGPATLYDPPSRYEEDDEADGLASADARSVAELAVPEPAAASAPLMAPRFMGPASWSRFARPVAVAAGGLLLLAAIFIAYGIGRNRADSAPTAIVQVTHNGHLAASVVTMENLAAMATDGAHMYGTIFQNGQAELAAIALPEGTVSPIDVPGEVASPALGGISPDGSRLVLRNHLSPESEQPLWIVPTLGGSALRVGSALAHDATWMPDGQNVLYANGNSLYVVGANGGSPELYATLPGRAFWLRWSPDGSLLRFTTIDPIVHTLELWQLSANDRKPLRLLAGFNSPASECCGVWTHDGRWFVFQSARGGNIDLWKLDGNARSGPTRVTAGPLQFQAPVASQTGSRIYFLGADARSELNHLTSSGELLPERGFLSEAVRVEYTRDGRRLVWTDIAGHLWCAQADGGGRLQLTPDNFDVFLARWSPDGSHLALMARVPGGSWNIYTVAADGSDLKPLMHEARNAADPSWSPDGQTLVFGRTNDRMGQENARSLEFVDVHTGAVRAFPGSDGLFSPRWSPDGRYIAALTLDQSRAELFDVAAGTWRALPVPSAADPVWSPDSHALFLHASQSPQQPIERITIPDGQVSVVARLSNATEANAVDYVLSGLAADGAPLIRTRTYTGDVFYLDLPH